MSILKELRLKHKYKTIDMARMLKVSPSFYSQIENNNRTLTYEMAVKIALIFNKKPDKIFYDEFIKKV